MEVQELFPKRESWMETVEAEKRLYEREDYHPIDDICLQDMYHPRNRYTPEEITAWMMQYTTTGYISAASKFTGIDPEVAKKWKQEAVWFDDLYNKCRQEKQKELDGILTRIVHQSTTAIEDRIENGDYKVKRDGTLHRVPMSGKDIAVTMAVLFDKRALIRGDVTTIQGRKHDDMKSLEAKFTEIAKKLQGKPIEGQVIDSKMN